MLKYIGDFKWLKTYGFAYAKEEFKKNNWYNDGRDVNKLYDYYYMGDGKYCNEIRIDGKTRLFSNINPDNYNDENDLSFFDTLFDLIQAGLVEKC